MDSSLAAANRFVDAITDSATASRDGRVLVVAHGGVTVDLLRTLVGDEAAPAFSAPFMRDGIPNCAVTRLALEGSWRVVDVADTAHLDG